MSHASAATVAASAVVRSAPLPPPVHQWSPVQRSFRHVLVALREAYYNDRAKLFWARHRVRIEYYKYAETADTEAVAALAAIGEEVAGFVRQHMQFSVQRIVDHNETLARLPVEDAKRFRARFLEREEEHDSWCKTRVKTILRRRPAPPYPYC